MALSDAISQRALLVLELKALAELLGPYGVGHLGYRMLQQISSQMQEIKVGVKVKLYYRCCLLCIAI